MNLYYCHIDDRINMRTPTRGDCAAVLREEGGGRWIPPSPGEKEGGRGAFPPASPTHPTASSRIWNSVSATTIKTLLFRCSQTTVQEIERKSLERPEMQ